MSQHRIHIHRPHFDPRPCGHGVIVPLAGHRNHGRCLDCGATVATPFHLHGSTV